jgi:hypothetical protein
MHAPVDRSEVLELRLPNPRARTPEALARKARQAMRKPPPPDATSALLASAGRREMPTARALRYLRHEHPELAEAFDEASLRASAAGKGWGCRWCLAELVASAHVLPAPRITPQNRALLGPECPKCPTSWTVGVYRRLQRRRPSPAEAAESRRVARQTVRMVRDVLYARQPRGSR